MMSLDSLIQKCIVNIHLIWLWEMISGGLLLNLSCCWLCLIFLEISNYLHDFLFPTEAFFSWLMHLACLSCSLLSWLRSSAIPTVCRRIIKPNYSLGQDNLINHIRMLLMVLVVLILLLNQYESLIESDSHHVITFDCEVATLSNRWFRWRDRQSLSTCILASVASTSICKRWAIWFIWILLYLLGCPYPWRIWLCDWFAHKLLLFSWIYILASLN